MSDPTSPRSVLESLLQGISDGNWNDLADLYDQQAVVEMPFAPSPPTRLEGREAVRAHFAAAAGGPLRVQASNIVVHDTGDPEVVIAEFDYDGQVSTAGRSFRVSIFRCSGSATARSCFHATITTTWLLPLRSANCTSCWHRSPRTPHDYQMTTVGKGIPFPTVVVGGAWFMGGVLIFVHALFPG